MKTEFKLVPVEPTDEMTIAGGMACQYVPDWEASLVYEAMLAAAPQPPALGGELGALLDQLDDYIARINGDDRGSDGSVNELRALLAQPADQQGEPFGYWCEPHGLPLLGIFNKTVEPNSGSHCNVIALYRHAQPATAKVVLPERLDLPHRDEFESADQHAAATGETKVWNACLDEVAKLNGGQT
ncbi:hypothetical protein [Pseudomonas cannabina]|uniref:Uncharacterized protein n=1 Tax=Pseudomonas cannabina TaxID=86840 RepID=A0A0P9R543_PSECA|nr:hypothetical protein [Pseudomonas cannabina]KAA8712905.1 hypothetical protein F4W70_09895 [Pseudomonas cannabina]KPW78564.1 Uncharacterized protein ALO81_00364 [Pseudomonas cannabina]SDR05660.1 hypothetical protein SAMN05216597_2133 [Pseudomonas cannabina]